MARITAGYRLVFRSYGMRLDGEDHFTGRVLHSGLLEDRQVIVHMGSSAYGGTAGLKFSLPRFVERTGVQLEVVGQPINGERLGGGPPQFVDILVLDKFEIEDGLAGRWQSSPDQVGRELDRVLKTMLKPLAALAEIIAAHFAIAVSEGAVKERVSAGEVYFTNDAFRYYSDSDVTEIVDLWHLGSSGFDKVAASSTRLLAGPQYLSLLALASHWYLRTIEMLPGVDSFLSAFLCLEVLSNLAMKLPAPQGLPEPWAQRIADLEALRVLETEASRRVVQRLTETRYAEPSLGEMFDRMVFLHPEDAKHSDSKTFREIARIRNSLMHGHIGEIPPTISTGQSTLLTIGDLAKRYLGGIQRTVVALGPTVKVLMPSGPSQVGTQGL